MPIEIPTEFELENWIPMQPQKGPPLPVFLDIYWPWYKPEVPPGAEFKVSDLGISHAEVQVGYPVTISCLVTNIGGEAGSYTVEMGGDFVAEQTVYLEPAESKVVSFDVTPTVAKPYSGSVNGLPFTFKAVEVPVADIRLENLAVSPTEVNVGKKVTISVTAINYGGAAGSKVITCTVS